MDFVLTISLKKASVRIYKSWTRVTKTKRQHFFFLVLLFCGLLFLKPPCPIYVEVGIVLVERSSEMKAVPPYGATYLRNSHAQVHPHPCSLFQYE